MKKKTDFKSTVREKDTIKLFQPAGFGKFFIWGRIWEKYEIYNRAAAYAPVGETGYVSELFWKIPVYYAMRICFA